MIPLYNFIYRKNNREEKKERITEAVKAEKAKVLASIDASEESGALAKHISRFHAKAVYQYLSMVQSPGASEVKFDKLFHQFESWTSQKCLSKMQNSLKLEENGFLGNWVEFNNCVKGFESKIGLGESRQAYEKLWPETLASLCEA